MNPRYGRDNGVAILATHDSSISTPSTLGHACVAGAASCQTNAIDSRETNIFTSSIEVAARSCDGAHAHHFLNKPLALRRHPCLPLLSRVHLHQSLLQHIPPFLVNVDPSYFFIQHVQISQVFRPCPSVIKMLLCPLQSSRPRLLR